MRFQIVPTFLLAGLVALTSFTSGASPVASKAPAQAKLQRAQDAELAYQALQGIFEGKDKERVPALVREMIRAVPPATEHRFDKRYEIVDLNEVRSLKLVRTPIDNLDASAFIDEVEWIIGQFESVNIPLNKIQPIELQALLKKAKEQRQLK